MSFDLELADIQAIYTVSQLNRAVRQCLEAGFAQLLVEGELSNLARPASGHWYFTLKDEDAQIRCAMFRGRNRSVGFVPVNGAQVRVQARISLYEARGDYQLIVDGMESAGDGALRRAYEALKHRLAGEGLFDVGHKRPLPVLPRQIGVITSPTGAAIRDILAVTGRRFPGIPVLVYAVPVQGDAAAPAIAGMIRKAGQRAECQVLILARGGGSLEDLWAFNHEEVARAIHACPIPVVTGIGHEIDTTIADLVADLYAPTPSVAAERVTPDAAAWGLTLSRQAHQLIQVMRTQLAHRDERLSWLTRRLDQQHPARRLQQGIQQLDELDLRLRRLLEADIQRHYSGWRELGSRLMRFDPSQRIALAQAMRRQCDVRQSQAMMQGLDKRRQALAAVCRALDAVSPLATLARGYAIVEDGRDGHLIRQIGHVRAGQAIKVRLYDGCLGCTVDTLDSTEDIT